MLWGVGGNLGGRGYATNDSPFFAEGGAGGGVRNKQKHLGGMKQK